MRLKVIHGKFDEEIAKALDSVESEGRNLAPSITFVDPFGLSDTPMSHLGRLLEHDKSEALITVMLGDLNWFLSSPNPKHAKRYDELFGS